MSGGRRDIRVTKAPKDMEVRIGRGRAVQGFMRSEITERFGGQDIDEVNGSMKRLDPVMGRKRSLKKKRANHIGDGPNHALGVAILLGRVWASETRDSAARLKKRFKFEIVKFATIISLKNFNLSIKLSLNKSIKRYDGVRSIRFRF